MNNKGIFIAYKYRDTDVKTLASKIKTTKVRDYVDFLVSLIIKNGYIYNGEAKDEDNSKLKDEEIWKMLKSKIRESSLTIVLISPNMKSHNVKDNEQWIAREVKYSLSNCKKRTNAMIGVILPNKRGLYNYCFDSYLQVKTGFFFEILEKNLFNRQDAIESVDINEPYIELVKWDEFLLNISTYIQLAYYRQNNLEKYNIKYR